MQDCVPRPAIRAHGTLSGRLRCRLPALLLLLLPPVPARAQTAHLAWVLAPVTTLLNQPIGVAVDGAGNVFVADAASGRVLKEAAMVGSGYSETVVYDASGSGGFPTGVAVQGTDVYVADYNLDRVVIVSQAAGGYGAPVPVATGLAGPWGVAVDAGGYVYISQPASGNVLRAQPPSLGGGAYTTSEYVSATTLGADFPVGLAVVPGGGFLYIACSSGGRILSFDGASIQSLAISGLSAPSSVAVDSGGSLYVADPGGSAGRLLKVTNPNTTLGVTTVAANLAHPAGVAVGPEGTVYYADQNQNALRKVVSAADFGKIPTGSSQAQTLGFVFDTPGTLGAQGLVLSQGAAGLDFFDPGTSGVLAGTSHLAGDSASVEVAFNPRHPGARYGAVRLTGADGSIAATALLNGTGSGPQVAFPGGNPLAAVAAAGTAARAGVALGADGSIYYADLDQHKVVKATPGPGGYTTTDVATGLVNPCGVAVNGAGDVYLVDSGTGTTDGSIQKAAWNGSSYLPPAAVLSNLQNPRYLAVDGRGSFFWSEPNHDAVFTATDTSGGAGIVGYGNGMNAPTGVAVDASGNVYASDANGKVWQMQPLPGSYTAPAAIATGLATPQGLAVDGAGAVYVAAAGQVLKLVWNPAIPAWSAPVQAVGGLTSAQAVAVDGGGSLALTDAGNGAGALLWQDLATPPTLDFGTLPAGSTAPIIRTVSLANNGDLDLLIPAPGIGTNPSLPAGFAWDSGNIIPQLNPGDPPLSLASGAGANLALSLQPAAVGSAPGSLVFTDNHLNAAGPGYTIQAVPLVWRTTATLALNDADLANQVYNGGPHAVRCLVDPAGVRFRVTYSVAAPGPTHAPRALILDGTAPPVDAKTYTVRAVIIDPYSTGATVQKTLVIAPAPVQVTLDSADLASRPFDGKPHPVGCATDIPGVPVTVAYSDGVNPPTPDPPVQPGSYGVTAAVADSNYTGSATGTLVITRAASTTATRTTLTVTQDTFAGDHATLAAQVSGAGQAPTGMVTFHDGAALLGAAALEAVAGTTSAGATLTLATLAAGSHAFRAAYSGDNANQPSEGTASGQVLAATVSFAGPAGNGTVLALTLTGTTPATLAFTATPHGAVPGGAAVFAATGLPPGATAAFDPPSLPALSRPTSITMTVRLPQDFAHAGPGEARPLSLPKAGGAMGGFLAFGLLALPWARRRRKGLWTGLAVLLALGLLGCWSRNPRSTTTTQAAIVAQDGAGHTVGSIPLKVTVVP